MRNKAVVVLAGVMGIASAGLTFLSWARLYDVGLYWNAFGVYTGPNDNYNNRFGPPLGHLVNTVPGWTVLTASVAATITVAAATRMRRLGLVAPVFAFVAFVAAVACLAHPAFLISDLKAALSPADPDRAFLNSGVVITEVVTTGVLVMCTSLAAISGIRRGRAERRSPVTTD
ncbi:hypothetical protein [Mycobacterium camsae]|uniref:hypothetical protein n=1 Tax=Mycobacterium gordonae TaxID=1778 RepID=UPI00197D6CF8|nr:hypothetical protein [Mycobacterium gordonae]